MLAVLLPALFLLAVTHAQPSQAQDPRAAARARMVAEIAAMARETGAETGRPRFGDAVMAAMGKVPRHRFVPALQDIFAYDNRPLPIGQGQTISQPYIVAPPARRARQVLGELGYRNVEVRVGDGYGGWPAAAPFDAIIVTAAPATVPQPLVDQLKPGGRMVIPVGGPSEVQQLLVVEKQSDGRTTTKRTLPVRVAPIT